MQQPRKILQVIEPEVTSDGAGVRLKRGIATATLNYLDPFLLFDHFGSENPDDYIAGFPMHPHRGIETVTYMLSGVVKHRDSGGNEGVIGPGDVQWMTAGSGVMHEEMPKTREGKMEGFQLWVNLPAKVKMMNPRYRDFKSSEIPEIEIGKGIKLKIIAGEVEGISGVITDIEAKPTYLDVELAANTLFEYKVPKGHSVFAYIFEGTANFSAESDNENVDSPKLIVFGEGDTVEITSSDKGARFLLISGRPLNEPVARYGPFVMNTKEEIQEALTDLQCGTFVKS